MFDILTSKNPEIIAIILLIIGIILTLIQIILVFFSIFLIHNSLYGNRISVSQQKSKTKTDTPPSPTLSSKNNTPVIGSTSDINIDIKIVVEKQKKHLYLQIPLLMTQLLNAISVGFITLSVVYDHAEFNVYTSIGVLFYGLSRLLLITIFLIRLHVAFMNSIYAVPKQVTKRLIILVILLGITFIIILGIVFIDQRSIEDKVPILTPFASVYLFVDVGLCIFILRAFCKRLYRLLVQVNTFATREADLKLFVPIITRYSNLVIIGLVSTVIFLLVCGNILSGLNINIWGINNMLLNVDSVVNGFCLYFIVNNKTKLYHKMCCLTHKCLDKMCLCCLKNDVNKNKTNSESQINDVNL